MTQRKKVSLTQSQQKEVDEKLANLKDEFCEGSSPRIMFFDIETTPAQFWGWRLGEQKLSINNIKKVPVICVICYAINDEPVQTLTFNLSKYKINEYDDDSDKSLIARFVKLSYDVDMVIAHNSPFDLGMLKDRIMKHRLPPMPPTLVDDTYLKTRAAKSMSHKLDFMLRYFGIGQKKETRGMPMWVDVAHKKKEALQEMVDYCVDDVEGLRSLYKYVYPYIKSSLNKAVFNGIKHICPKCGGSQFEKRGFNYSQTAKKQRLHCLECDWWGDDGINLLKSKKKKKEGYLR